MLFTIVCFVIDLICWFVFFGFVVWDSSTLKFLYDYNTVFGGSADYSDWLQDYQNSGTPASEEDADFDSITSAFKIYQEFMFFMLTSVYIVFDLYYPLWVMHQRLRLPKLSVNFDKALCSAMLGSPGSLLAFYDVEP